MEKLYEYNIVFIKLANGVHHFDYHVGNTFFTAFESSLIQEATLDVAVVLTKEQAHVFDLDFHIKGIITRTCDRCLDDFPFPIDTHFNLLVKQTEKEKENESDITYLPMSEYQINLAKYIYDICNLAIPMRTVCEDSKIKKCNNEVEKKLEELERANLESETEDPRWDALKDLLKDNKKDK